MADTVIKAARERQGLGLREASRLSGVDVGFLSKLERGEVGCSVTTLAELAPVLGLGPGDMGALLDEARRRKKRGATAELERPREPGVPADPGASTEGVLT